MSRSESRVASISWQSTRARHSPQHHTSHSPLPSSGLRRLGILSKNTKHVILCAHLPVGFVFVKIHFQFYPTPGQVAASSLSLALLPSSWSYLLMGCFAFKSGKNRSKKQKPVASPAKTPPPSDSSGQNKGKAASSSSTPTRSIQELSEERGAQRLRVFDLDELRSATNGFSRALKLGEGGFGSVYRAFFRSAAGGRVVLAVKRLNQRSQQGHKQWLAEVQFLGVLEHANLVKLIGYCAVDSGAATHRLLVYEFMPNKTLDDHLFNRAHPPLSWRMRLQIMVGAGRGLDYLHEGVPEVQVIYRDFKASNVLLDAEFKPKLSDFGLAREGPTEGKTHVSTAVVGTQGYAAPDYIETGHLTVKSDVWSFGVVLYEILTGRRSLERSRPAEEQKLLAWVRRHPPDSQSFRTIMDPRLGGRYPLHAAREVARLADRCLVKKPKERPAMRDVVEELERVLQMEPTGDAVAVAVGQ